MSDKVASSWDAATTPVGISGVCASCGATLDPTSLSCPRCGGTITPGGRPPATTPGASPMDHNERLRARLQEAIGTEFQLLELLGRGGMGIVFRAREEALDREVALKVLAIDPLMAPDAYERFEREAKLAARLDHPNIVPIFAVGKRETLAYYTMRLVRGGSAEEMIAAGRKGALDPTHVFSILRDVAAALDYAHGHGIIHRDIKPANILIGETGHALVADFGIAKALGPTSGATGTGIIGTPGYMSPEQWRGEELDGRADQYSLGVVAYEMLAGRRPFDAGGVQELVKLHLSAEVPDLALRRPGIAPEVSDAIRRALAKDRNERFPTAMAFVDALAGTGAGTIPVRTMRGPRYVAPPKRRRHVLRWVVLMLLVAGGVAYAVPQSRAVVMPRARALQRVVERQALRAGLIPPPPKSDPFLDSLAALGIGPGAERDSALAAHDSVAARVGGAVASPATDSARAAAIAALRRPIGFDTTLAPADPRAGFRSAPAADVGYVTVQVVGGTSQPMVDGTMVDGFTPMTLRLEPGSHYISVQGAGINFLPSQIQLNVTAGDTVKAVFAVPSAIVRRPRPADSATTAAAPGSTSAPGAPASAAPPAHDSASATAPATAPAPVAPPARHDSGGAGGPPAR